MKFRVTLKDPDGFHEQIQQAAEDQVGDFDGPEVDLLIQKRTDNLLEGIEKWVEYQEYITIEFDLDNKTATVVPAGE